MLPSVSIVTISFRDLDGLRRTVESVAGLDYPGRKEHIVIDGGSGLEVERFLADSAASLAYWQSAPDRGRYAAMNIGAAKATGDVLWFMHSGDTFANPQSVDVAMTSLTGGWGYGAVRRLGGDCADLGVWGCGRFRLRRFAAGVAPIPHQAAFFRADLFRGVGGYDESFGLAADHLMMLRCAAIERPTVLASIVCDFDATGAGTVRPVSEHFVDIRKSLRLLGYWPFRSRATAVLYVAWCESVVNLKLFVRRLAGRSQR
ncbi:glycosyltransferase [Actinomycetes bacterium M1A6_2h]